MFKKFVQLCALAATAQASLEKETTAQDHWAVIVVGSRGYGNYRHHADGCHAYHQAVTYGIPADQIIMIAYDDVAQDRHNPYPGKLFNKPTKKGTKGVDVYADCVIDYKGTKANKDTVLGVLKGDTSVGKKVLNSNTDSKVFFYFADHGAPNILGMPSGKFLYADELNSAIEYMHKNKMYKEMVMYIEACESGSIFANLKKNINVYATTAANAKESSWGTYCHPDDMVDGKSIGSCLGDLYSVNWMEDLDHAYKKKQLGVETLQTQYESVKTKTTRSHVLQWGDLKIADEVIGEFEAGTYKKPKDLWSILKQQGKEFLKSEIGWNDADTQRKNDFAVDTRDIELHYLYKAALENPSVENQKALMDMLDHRLTVDLRFKSMFPEFIEKVQMKEYPEISDETDFDCYRKLIDEYTETCEEPDSYTSKYFGAFLHQCMAIRYYAPAFDDFKAKLSMVCTPAENEILQS